MRSFKRKITFAPAQYVSKMSYDHLKFDPRRGAGVVTEQIANLSTRKCRLGSSPSLSAFALQSDSVGGHLYKTWRASADEYAWHYK